MTASHQVGVLRSYWKKGYGMLNTVKSKWMPIWLWIRKERRPQVRPLAASFWMLAALAVAAAAIWVTSALLLNTAKGAAPGTEQAKLRLDAVRIGLAAGAGSGAAVGLMLAFRRQRHQEIATALSDHDAAE